MLGHEGPRKPKGKTMSNTTAILESVNYALPTKLSELANAYADHTGKSVSTARKHINDAIKNGELRKDEDGLVHLVDTDGSNADEPVEDEDLLGELDEVLADDDLLGAEDDETPEIGATWIIESGKHAGHEWKHTASGGYCVDCDAALAAFWKRVEARLTELGKSYDELRKAAKDANEKIINFARALDRNENPFDPAL